jgi:two-component system cell cycle response regulator
VYALTSQLDTHRDEDEHLTESVGRGPRCKAAMTVLRGELPGALFPLHAEETVIGRDPDVTISLPEHSLSRQHARVRRAGHLYSIEDLNSTNGTFVDGVRVSGTHPLEDGCRVHLGTRTVLHFRMYDSVELAAACETYALTVRDPLTGVYNRRYLQDRLWSEAAYCRRHGTPLSLILLDIDHFKRINDVYGHSIGDDALRTLASTLLQLTRQEDVLARYGGEEFALIARGIDREGTLAFAERIRRGVESQRLATPSGLVTFTVSVGVAHSENGADSDVQALLETADRALYSAKEAGRNRVSLSPAAG